jgi:hypothetical protein
LEANPIPARWERDASGITLHFAQPELAAAGLAQVLQRVAENGVTLVAIHSLHDEMIDAFIQLLEEERAHGFSSIPRLETPLNGVSSPGGRGPEQPG